VIPLRDLLDSSRDIICYRSDVPIPEIGVSAEGTLRRSVDPAEFRTWVVVWGEGSVGGLVGLCSGGCHGFLPLVRQPRVERLMSVPGRWARSWARQACGLTPCRCWRRQRTPVIA